MDGSDSFGDPLMELDRTRSRGAWECCASVYFRLEIGTACREGILRGAEGSTGGLARMGRFSEWPTTGIQP